MTYMCTLDACMMRQIFHAWRNLDPDAYIHDACLHDAYTYMFLDHNAYVHDAYVHDALMYDASVILNP